MSDEPSPPTSKPSAPPASGKDKHDFLVALLKEAHYGMIDFMFKQATVLTLFIGWIIYSNDGRQFIQSHYTVRNVMVAAIILYAPLLAFWTWNYRRRSESAHRHLLRLGFMPSEFYAMLVVTRPLAFSFIAAHCILCVLLIILLLQVSP